MITANLVFHEKQYYETTNSAILNVEILPWSQWWKCVSYMPKIECIQAKLAFNSNNFVMVINEIYAIAL